MNGGRGHAHSPYTPDPPARARRFGPPFPRGPAILSALSVFAYSGKSRPRSAVIPASILTPGARLGFRRRWTLKFDAAHSTGVTGERLPRSFPRKRESRSPVGRPLATLDPRFRWDERAKGAAPYPARCLIGRLFLHIVRPTIVEPRDKPDLSKPRLTAAENAKSRERQGPRAIFEH